MNVKEGLWIGTSGFSYEDWKGSVYPDTIRKNQWFDYYVSLFNTIELNSSFYAFPGEKTITSLCGRAPGSFLFTVKAHQSITHERKSENIPRFVEVLHSFDKKGFLPLALFQFPYSFHKNPESFDFLKACFADFPYPLSVEFRNQEWVREDSLKQLSSLGIPVVSVDEPAIKGLLPKNVFSKELLYLRFHGRNAEKWWNHEQAYERYDYSYTREELEEWILPLLESEASVKVVYFNNHFRGQAVRNAKMFAEYLEKHKSKQEEKK
jgi:uncharacterized protein YecE (DUF72 family)